MALINKYLNIISCILLITSMPALCGEKPDPYAEMLDLQGTILEGYELENSKELIGNEIEKAVSWKGNPDLKKLVNKPIRLRFVMKDSDLYSLKFN